MQQQTTGIRFSETIAGGMMHGESDYRRGEQMARVAGHILAIHVQASIDDLERFLVEPQHYGQLEGTIDYPPFGNGLASTAGRFNLFSPTEQPNTKLMIYELGFEHGGEPFYLVGHKEVRDDPGFDMWSDTTTLYTRLLRGGDTSGEIIAAGILTLGMAGLMSLLSSMEVTGADSTMQKIDTLTRFGRFFLGELWDSYAGIGGRRE
ncbi:MAG: hypothetical protein P8171_23090 [Candidatus Thiodiazotropha sp.]